LLLFLLAASIGCAALANANQLWQQAAVTVTVSVLLLAPLAAIYLTKSARPFALGFSIAGWIYFLLAFSSVLNVRGYLLTDTGSEMLLAAMHDEQLAQRAVVTFNGPIGARSVQLISVPPPLPATKSAPTLPTPAWQPAPSPMYSVVPAAYPAPLPAPALTIDAQAFRNVAHSLWTLIAGCIGGVLAQLLARRRSAEMAE
jgi:hypothetical protein